MTDDVHHQGSLSDAELQEFTGLLRRFCMHDLDQWENWQLGTEYGPVYVMLSRALPPGATSEAFREI
jgi:hypothetical protein